MRRRHATSPTVMVSVPSPQVSMDVAAAVADGDRIRQFIDLSTVGHQAAQHNHALLARHGVAALDSPVSGAVHRARAGTLAVMVSTPPPTTERAAAITQAAAPNMMTSPSETP